MTDSEGAVADCGEQVSLVESLASGEDTREEIRIETAGNLEVEGRIIDRFHRSAEMGVVIEVTEQHRGSRTGDGLEEEFEPGERESRLVHRERRGHAPDAFFLDHGPETYDIAAIAVQ